LDYGWQSCQNGADLLVWVSWQQDGGHEVPGRALETFMVLPDSRSRSLYCANYCHAHYWSGSRSARVFRGESFQFLLVCSRSRTQYGTRRRSHSRSRSEIWDT